VRAHTLQRFGPVRAVEPTQVFELHFEGIARSTRHKSGVAVRFPRIARWRTDKPASEADTLETLKRLISPPPSLTPG
jgi:DNA ligase-1